MAISRPVNLSLADRRLWHTLTVEYGTDGRFGWQSAALSEKKRNVILLSYFMDMSDAEIAKEMHVVRSTIHEHRKQSLELLKKIMERTDEKRK